MDTLGNHKNNIKNDTQNKDKKLNNVNKSNNNFFNNNQSNLRKSTKKHFIEVNSSVYSTDFSKQKNHGKDQNESVQITRKYSNINLTSMNMATTVNEKFDLNNINQKNEYSTVKSSNNINLNLIPISETKDKFDEEEYKYSPRKTTSKGLGSPRNFNNTASTIMSEKEKRAVLEHFHNLYSFKKPNPSKNSPSQNQTKMIPSFPMISQNNKKMNKNKFLSYEMTNSNQDLNKNAISSKTSSLYFESKQKNSYDFEEDPISTQKNSMFRSSIYSNLIPTNFKELKNKKNQSLQKQINNEPNEFETETSSNKLSKYKIKNNVDQTTYGPFLHIDNKYSKKIEIKNPEIKRSLEDINYYGPHFSHCPICRFKNLEFYQNMEPHQCMKLLNYIKSKRSKIQLK